MRIPVIHGLIDRRILINYTVDPTVLAAVIPPPFRPQLVDGVGIAGICLIRLAHIRPRCTPRWLGVASENIAHRFAVEWDESGVTRQGVYIARRDTSSAFNALVGGRLFPGVHGRARFTTHESGDDFRLDIQGRDMRTRVVARVAGVLPSTSVFNTLATASTFFEHGSVGYSPGHSANQYERLELRSLNWRMTPLAVSELASSYFDDQRLFPAGSIRFDSALLMRGVEHQWLARPAIDGCCHGGEARDTLPLTTADSPACSAPETPARL